MDEQNAQVDNPRPNRDTYKYNVGKNEVVIRREDLKPLNDPNCEHNFVLDGEVIGTTRAWVCSKCHRGTFLPKTIQRIT